MGDGVDLLDPFEFEDLLVELNGIRITNWHQNGSKWYLLMSFLRHSTLLDFYRLDVLELLPEGGALSEIGI